MKKGIMILVIVGLLGWAVYDFIESNHEKLPGKESEEKQEDYLIGLEKGNLAPDFELQTLDGKQVKLSDYRGSRVMINFLGNMVSTVSSGNARYGEILSKKRCYYFGSELNGN